MNGTVPRTYIADIPGLISIPDPIPYTPKIQQYMVFIAAGFVIICAIVASVLLKKVKKL